MKTMVPALSSRLLLAAGVAVGASSTAFAQIPLGSVTFDLVPVASGLVAPVQMKPAPDGSGRLFIVEQTGVVRILNTGTLLPTPFLDVRPLMIVPNAGYDERGLLGLAFHPDYTTNGRFFVHYSAPRAGNPGDPCVGTPRGCSSEVIAEYHVSAANPNLADPVGTVLLSVAKPQFNHAGGGLDFGPDGLLYVALGDGGGANDGLADNPPSHGAGGNAQNLGVKLGKILRYDANTPGVLNIPATNPFVGMPGADPAIYAYGVRNPYAFSFDDLGPGATDQFWVGEVGQDAFEEVDIVTAGGNYGWPLKEGTHCFDPFATTTPPPTCPAADGTIAPIADYAHAANGIAIVGGYIYRGSQNPSLTGLYLFGDFSTSFGAANGQVFYLNPAQPSQIFKARLGAANAPLGKYLKGMGRDNNGEIYYLTSTVLGPTGTTGQVLRVQVMCDTDLNQDGNADQGDIDYLINVV
ncbi:MAG: PQQ-dependent sugar dehydrogenase, partial [Phycisphaerales bacterium]